VTQTASARLATPVSERDHVRGDPASPVTLVEYGDFECPYCRALEPILGELRERLGDQLLLVFRHFPQTSSHPHSFRAAQAAEAAGAQGKFWEMHDLLYANQQALEDEHLEAYAADLGLDTARFARELRDEVHAERVREDMRTGFASGVAGTPTLYLDGTRFDTTVGLQELLAAIRQTHPELEIPADADPAPRGRRIPRVRHLRTPRS
jgi:formate-nitrite transporter family protein